MTAEHAETLSTSSNPVDEINTFEIQWKQDSYAQYTPSRVPSRPIIISIEVIICCATGAGIDTA